jgi:hypothetical protein
MNHNAGLAVAAGGVDAILIGTEMRCLTQVRDGTGAFPFVTELKALAAEVRAIVGSGCKITYAADWSEYFGYHPQDGTGDVFFHLDTLWADGNIDAIGIDNYMPLSDWRDADEADPAGNPDGQLQAADRAAFRAAIAGGEGFDWYYASDDDRRARIRAPITDGLAASHGCSASRISFPGGPISISTAPEGAELAQPTGWMPQGKPIWLMELGCPGYRQGRDATECLSPIAKSAESAVPWFSNGGRDDAEQRAFLQAHLEHWASGPDANPLSPVYRRADGRSQTDLPLGLGRAAVSGLSDGNRCLGRRRQLAYAATG